MVVWLQFADEDVELGAVLLKLVTVCKAGEILVREGESVDLV